MNSELELLKRVQEKTLERVIEKFGTGLGQDLNQMKLSIMDVRTILYDEVRKQAESIIDEDKRIAMEEFSR
ncbi:hypothetical protein LCGC14_0622620 [marine sediment metagenome]|uniref:Uncharacterized protein n=1 Tax=marine sediment metagenome TaxID=412755 RepID=A0A0F9TQR9_9ZZZZ